MDQEQMTSDDCDLTKSFSSELNAYSTLKDEPIPLGASDSAFASEEIDLDREEKQLTEFVWRDARRELVLLSQKIAERRATEQSDGKRKRKPLIKASSSALELLHLACKLDAADCAAALLDGDTALGIPNVNAFDRFGRLPLHDAAEAHAIKCIDLLLKRQARTDLRSKDENSYLPLELALTSNCMQVVWSVNESIEELLFVLEAADLSASKLLAEKTDAIKEVTVTAALDGQVVCLAVLLILAAENIMTPALLLKDVGVDLKSETTIYELVVRKALSLGQEGGSLKAHDGSPNSAREKKRTSILREIELLNFFGAVDPSNYADRKLASLLISAAQAGDEVVLDLLLKTNLNVNGTDEDGNTALHWCLKRSISQRIIWHLIKKGARVCQRNKLGLTSLHVAAGSGNVEALKILLDRDSSCIDVATEIKETPLFFAVKNDCMECTELLLRHGANAEVLNLRRQRPVDLARSQDMRFMLSSLNLSFWSNSGLKQNSYFVGPIDDGYNAETLERVPGPNAGSPRERSCTETRSEICRYYESPGGCARGAKCNYVHGEDGFWGWGSRHELVTKAVSGVGKNPHDFNRKVFVGGLPSSINSDQLKEFFENEFGPVEKAIVIGSQDGEQSQSRGFGFVTFKQGHSFTAAVQAHFVSILSKRVEIKSAVPKGFLQEPPLSPHNHHDVQGPDDTGETLPSWVSILRRWLPSFLLEASKRLREGEWYPLSSLKSDFRATCGMELDHASRGYPKLSDFIHSLGLCRMKVVPVGRGPATHLVLLPLCPEGYYRKQKPLPIGEFPCSSIPKQNNSNVSHPSLGSSISSNGQMGSDHPNERISPEGKGEQSENAQPEQIPSRLLSFLSREPSPFTPWYMQTGPTASVGWDFCFSVFYRQFDYYENLRKLGLGMCIRCRTRRATWLSQPCGHKELCNSCKNEQITPHKCSCGAYAMDFQFVPWATSKVLEAQSFPSLSEPWPLLHHSADSSQV